MTRLQPPVCPTCQRRHWELVATETAAVHCHMERRRFRDAIDKGKGPTPWAHDIYTYPRYHVDELDRWLATTAVAA